MMTASIVSRERLGDAITDRSCKSRRLTVSLEEQAYALASRLWGQFIDRVQAVDMREKDILNARDLNKG